MAKWMRDHDAWIADKVEGLEVFPGNGCLLWKCQKAGDSKAEMPHYNSNLNQAIRALRAWLKALQQNEEKFVQIRCSHFLIWNVVLRSGYERGRFAEAHGQDESLPTAIAAALYRATGGPRPLIVGPEPTYPITSGQDAAARDSPAS